MKKKELDALSTALNEAGFEILELKPGTFIRIDQGAYRSGALAFLVISV